MALESKQKEMLKYVYIDEISYDNEENDNVSQPWLLLTKYPIPGMHNNVIQYIIPADSTQFIVYNYEVYNYSRSWSWEEQHPDKKFVDLGLGFYIYNIKQNKWTKSVKYDQVEPSVNERRLSPQTAMYANKTNTLTIYDGTTQSQQFIEYNLTSDIWHYDYYPQTFLFRPSVAYGTSYDGYYEGYLKFKYSKTSQQCVLVDDKLHIFGYQRKCYKHSVYDMKSREIKEIKNDNSDALSDYILFNAETQLIYCKLKNCIYVLDIKGGVLHKYLITEKKWNKMENVEIPYQKLRSVLCANGKYILFFCGYDYYGTRKRLKDIFVFNILTETVGKSQIPLPSYDLYQAVSINEYNNKLLILIHGFIQSCYGLHGCVENIISLINSYTPNEYIYILSMLGDLYKMEVNRILNVI